MSTLLTPSRLRRGFSLFVLISVLAFAGVFVYGDDAGGFLASLSRIHWQWMLLGLVLASMDWIGGGLRLWVLLRETGPAPPLGGMILAGGMGAWAGYLTPLQAGGTPMTIYAMNRAGVPVPRALTALFMSFIATVIFFALSGSLALVFGAGQALGAQGNFLGFSLLDLFKMSMGIFVVLGVLMLLVLIAPGLISTAVHGLATALGKRSTRVRARLEGLRSGIDQAHASMVTFNTPRGWLALFWATIISGPSHANKLLSGYVALRAIGIEVPFVDVLLLQTFLTSILYFAPTPGGSGIGELLSALVMSLYVPRELTPIYTLVWRCILSWYTIAAGFVIFSAWVRKGFKTSDEPAPAA